MDDSFGYSTVHRVQRVDLLHKSQLMFCVCTGFSYKHQDLKFSKFKILLSLRFIWLIGVLIFLQLLFLWSSVVVDEGLQLGVEEARHDETDDLEKEISV